MYNVAAQDSKMNAAIVVILICCSAYTQGLKCMKCFSAGSFEECDVSGQIRQCLPNEESCETVVRRSGNHMTVTKDCKDTNACNSNQMQNNANSGRSTQCNADQISSFCTCCCGSDMCNAGTPTCVPYYQPVTPVNDCPALSQSLPHGNVECYNENKAGAVCEYQCTSKDYGVWPNGRNTNVCQGNGTWSHEAPCCARPCPPYFLFDDVMLIHFAGDKAEEELQETLTAVQFSAIEEDAVKHAVMYYSGQPIESSVVKFNEYGANATRLFELVTQRVTLQNEGPVNTGAAIQYALDNLLTQEAGMRDNRVPKTITVISDRNSDDDVKGPAEEARRRGILIYFLGMAVDGYEFDREQLLELTGVEEHILAFDQALSTLTDEHVADMMKHFCRNPCDHVLHAHGRG